MREENEALFVRAASGDLQAVAGIATQYGPDLFRLARCLLNSYEEARDAVADIIARLCADPGIIPSGLSRSWLMRVTYNHCVDLLRRRKTLQRLLPKIYDRTAVRPQPGPEQTALKTAEQVSVRQAVAGLPEQERAIVFLRYYQGLSYAEIAAVLGIPGPTVGTRLHRAREKLRKRLDHF